MKSLYLQSPLEYTWFSLLLVWLWCQGQRSASNVTSLGLVKHMAALEWHGSTSGRWAVSVPLLGLILEFRAGSVCWKSPEPPSRTPACTSVSTSMGSRQCWAAGQRWWSQVSGGLFITLPDSQVKQIFALTHWVLVLLFIILITINLLQIFYIFKQF